jgi:exosortase
MKTIIEEPSSTEAEGCRSLPSLPGKAGFLRWLAGATVIFALPLYELVRLSLKSELHSHLLLIPAVSWYVWRFIDRVGTSRCDVPVRAERTEAGEFTRAVDFAAPPLDAAGTAQRAVPTTIGGPSNMWVAFAVLGSMAAAGYFVLRWNLRTPVTEYLWAGILGYLLVLLAGATRSFGWGRLREHSFAIAFLVFFIPLPLLVTDFMSVALQRASAEVLDGMLQLTGLPAYREGLAFDLPGLHIKVAEECSGVRSTLCLFIFSLVAGKVLLKTGWKRWTLALLTVPLGILRNAFRITLLAYLSVHVDPNIIHGPLHHQGGPVFFVLSLIPLFALLWYFRRSESAKSSSRK